ncbi:hypothetical protein HDV00_007744 [Rhizophlyctis rosea]|nr:hypothetical protein HDV00_007744 [Rhizophlyctis rosea]
METDEDSDTESLELLHLARNATKAGCLLICAIYLIRALYHVVANNRYNRFSIGFVVVFLIGTVIEAMYLTFALHPHKMNNTASVATIIVSAIRYCALSLIAIERFQILRSLAYYPQILRKALIIILFVLPIILIAVVIWRYTTDTSDMWYDKGPVTIVISAVFTIYLAIDATLAARSLWVIWRIKREEKKVLRGFQMTFRREGYDAEGKWVGVYPDAEEGKDEVGEGVEPKSPTTPKPTTPVNLHRPPYIPDSLDRPSSRITTSSTDNASIMTTITERPSTPLKLRPPPTLAPTRTSSPYATLYIATLCIIMLIASILCWAVPIVESISPGAKTLTIEVCMTLYTVVSYSFTEALPGYIFR